MKQWVGFLVLLLILATGAQGLEIMPLDEIMPGQTGYGLTVIRGTEVQKFSVEVLSVIPGQPVTGSLILVRVGGELMESTGGIAAGMSGSPVYINDRLVGAIGYGFDHTDHRLGLVTPIGAMLDLWEVNAWKQVPPNVIPISTPVMVSGLGDRAYRRLSQRWQDSRLQPVRGGGSLSSGPVAMSPGSAIGVQLARGDVTVMAVGTLTAILDDRFLAFGHSFLNRGQTALLASGAYIHTVIPQQVMPFKLASGLDPVGTVTQDRYAGLSGQLGVMPEMVALEVGVRDLDRGGTRIMQVDVVPDPVVLSDIGAVVALQAIDEGLDRIGPGTALVSMEFHGQGLPTPIRRENRFYSSMDIGALALNEFLEAIHLILSNPFVQVDLEFIDLWIEVVEARETAMIIEARPLQDQVFPGQTVEVEVVLRPFRRAHETWVVSIEIPESAVSGKAHLTVRGGGLYGVFTQNSDVRLDDDGQAIEADDLTKLIDDFSDRERNDDLVLEYFPSFGQWGARSLETRRTGEEQTELEDEFGFTGSSQQPVRSRTRTPYIIEGSADFEIIIATPEEPKEELPPVEDRVPSNKN